MPIGTLINLEWAPSFCSKAFMQTYREGFDACSHSPNSPTIGGNFINWSATAFVQKPYWSPTPLNLNAGFKQFHGIIYGLNSHYLNGVIQVCLKTEVDTHTLTGHIRNDGYNPPLIIEHKGCTNIDVAKALKTSGENVTLDTGYFIFPTWMTPKPQPPDIQMDGRIKIKEITTCGIDETSANNPELVYFNMPSAYGSVIDYYSDLGPNSIIPL
ncbi:MAG: hypothetical protein WBP64_21180 [Nitrososphaeraceae archaeon]